VKVSNWARDCVPFVEGLAKRTSTPTAPREFLSGLVNLAVDKLQEDYGGTDEYDEEG
jgi:hypothetical protein